MFTKKCLFAAVLGVAALASGSALAGTVTGTVTYEGKVPNLKPITMDADPSCAKKHTTPVPSDTLLLGDGNTMGNILVRVVGGLPAGKTWPAPTTPAVLDQNGCRYEPHVLARLPSRSGDAPHRCQPCPRGPRHRRLQHHA